MSSMQCRPSVMMIGFSCPSRKNCRFVVVDMLLCHHLTCPLCRIRSFSHLEEDRGVIGKINEQSFPVRQEEIDGVRGPLITIFRMVSFQSVKHGVYLQDDIKAFCTLQLFHIDNAWCLINLHAICSTFCCYDCRSPSQAKKLGLLVHSVDSCVCSAVSVSARVLERQ